MPTFLELDADQFQIVAPVLEHEAGQCTIMSEGGPLCTLRHSLECNSPENPQDFYVLLCSVGNVREADTRKLISSSGREQLGYCFPLTAFRSGIGIESDWAIKFAEVGFRKFLTIENVDQYSVLRNTSELRNRELALEDIFSENYSLFVFSLVGLNKADITKSYLELSLLDHGVKVVRTHRVEDEIETARLDHGDIRLRVPRSVVEADLEIFCKLLNHADNDTNGVGRFLIYYQLFEHCIDQIFDREVRKLPALGLNSWQLKEKLSELTSEVKRMGYMNESYLLPSVRRSAFDALKQECLTFLQGLAEQPKTDDQWYKLLYSVRNIIVHNQMRFHRATGNMDLSGINTKLRAASIEALFAFYFPP